MRSTPTSSGAIDRTDAGLMSELPVDAEQPGQTGVLDSLGVGESWGDRCTSDSRLVRPDVSIAATEYGRAVFVKKDPSA
jgi:hypothetical protein